MADAEASAADTAAMAERFVRRFDGIEVAESATYTWSIPDWTMLGERETSPEFEVGGMRWQILLFPHGNPASVHRGNAALYLNALGSARSDSGSSASGDNPTERGTAAVSTPETVSTENGDSESSPDPSRPPSPGSTGRWHSCASFALSMWNEREPSVHVTQSTHHRFTPRVSDWGYNEFTSLRGAFVKAHGAAAPLIDGNDNHSLAVNITVYIDVLKDPTGVLWHDFQDYDSREATGYTGLVNQGATCYLNSLLQSLYFTKAFRRAVYEIPESEGVTGGLQRLFYMLSTSHPPVDTTDLTRAFGWDTADAFTQHDVQELARVLMDRLESKMKGTSVDGFLSRLFVGQMKSYIKCINVPFESARTEDFWDVQLNVRGMTDVYASFRNYCSEETLEGDNQYAAGEYGLQDAVKGVVFESLPPVLHLQLKRYDYDWMRDIEVKINDRYEFPLELDLSEFVDKPGPWQYDLHGVLVHSGNLNAGHYYTLIKPEAGGGWYRFDDDRVTKATLAEVLEQNYGGDEGSLLRRVTSAYMLVYIRRDSLDFVLPNSKERIPETLAERIDQERKDKEMRQRSIAEQQQFMVVQTLNDATFAYHRGPGILPWSSSREPDELERPSSLKLRIGTPLSAARKQLNAGMLWLAPPESAPNARVRAKKVHSLFDADDYGVEQLSRWIVYGSPVVFSSTAPPSDDIASYRFVFVKQFANGELTGVRTAWLSASRPLGETIRDEFREILPDFSKLHLEVTSPTRRKVASDVLVQPLNLDETATDAGIEHSDILVVSSESADIVESYFDTLAHRVTLVVTPMSAAGEESDSESNSSNSETDSIEITASTRDSYESVVSAVATALDWPVEKLLLFSPSQRWGRPVPIASDGSNLSELWGQSSADALRVLYRKLNVSLAEYETMAEITISFLPEGYMAREEKATILAKPEASLELPASAGESLMWVVHGPLVKELENPSVGEIASMQDQGLVVYAAPIARIEKEARSRPGARLATAFHFAKDPSRTHGVAFQFAVVPGEPFSETRARLYTLLRRNGDADRALEKIRFAIISSSRPQYIEDAEKLVLSDALGEGDSIGLDHPDRRRFAYQQQAIHID